MRTHDLLLVVLHSSAGHARQSAAEVMHELAALPQREPANRSQNIHATKSLSALSYCRMLISYIFCMYSHGVFEEQMVHSGFVRGFQRHDCNPLNYPDARHMSAPAVKSVDRA
jgi:hypothetical protein